MVLEGYLYVGTSLRSLHMFSAFGTRAVFSMDACLLSLSSVYAGHYPLERWCDWPCGDQNLHWILSRVSSLLCGCHCPVKGRVFCLLVGMEAPRSISELKYEVGAIGTLPLERSLWVFLCQSCSPSVLSCVTFHLLLLALPSTPPQLWECQRSALGSLRCCFTRPPVQIHWSLVPRPLCSFDLQWKLWRQLRSWPGPGSTSTHPRSLQLLRPDLSQL